MEIQRSDVMAHDFTYAETEDPSLVGSLAPREGRTLKVLEACLWLADHLPFVSPATAMGRMMLFAWEELPFSVREVFCYNGGDEDFLFVCRNEPNPKMKRIFDILSDRLGTPDVYHMGDIKVIVFSHA